MNSDDELDDELASLDDRIAADKENVRFVAAFIWNRFQYKPEDVESDNGKVKILFDEPLGVDVAVLIALNAVLSEVRVGISGYYIEVTGNRKI